MNLEIGLWIVPLALTVISYLMIPRRKLSGDYDIGIDNAFYFLAWVIWSLFVWLCYFALLAFLNDSQQ